MQHIKNKCTHTEERWKERARQTEIYSEREKERGREKWMKGSNFRERTKGGAVGGGGVERNGSKEGKREREGEEGERAMEGGELRRGGGGEEGEREEMVAQRLVQYLKKDTPSRKM